MQLNLVELLPIIHLKPVEIGVTKTMTEKKKPTSNKATDKKLEEIKNHLLSTGLEDYGFWWQEMAKKKAAQSEPDQPFRRGRIWS